MKITNAKYFKSDGKNCSITTVINGKEWSVPLDPANTHYIAIQEWVAEGNTIEAAD